MRAALLLALALLTVAAPVAVPTASASVCTPNYDFARACVVGTTDCLVSVKFGGDRFCVPG
jgi:hypothetical protein